MNANLHRDPIQPSRYAVAALFGGLLTALLPFLLLARYVHPSSDDFCFGRQARVEGVWGTLTSNYLQWGGRFTTFILLGANPLGSGSWTGYRLIPVVSIILLAAVLYLFIRAALFADRPRIWSVAAALTVVVLYLEGMPDLAQGVYWMSATVAYGAGNTLAVLCVAAIILAARSTKLPRLGWCSVSLLSAFFAMGTNEIVLVILLGLTIAFAVDGRVMDRANRLWAWPLVGCIAGVVVFFLSPGNGYRISVHSGNQDFIWSLTQSGFRTTWFVTSWLSSAPLVLCTLFFALIALERYRDAPATERDWHPALAPVLTLLLIVASFFPALWSLGVGMPRRAVNPIYLFFLLAWFVNIDLLCRRYSRRFLAAGYPWGGWTSTALIGLLAVSLFGGWFRPVVEEATRVAPTYDRELSHRYQLIEAALVGSEDTDLVVPPLTFSPETFHDGSDIGSDSRHWINACYARYFGIRSIAVPAVPPVAS